MLKFIILVALSAVLCSFVSSQSDDKLHITLLYESLCPDSKRFMQQLGPVYDELGDYIDLELVPFGKSFSEGNGALFHCQHGPRECQGNRLQHCVISGTSDKAAQVDFVVCQMWAPNSANIKKCANDAGLSADIKECVETPVGTKLQLEAEQITNLYRPSFIPTIIYNGVFDQALQDNSIRNFRATVCHMLRQRNLMPPSTDVCQ